VREAAGALRAHVVQRLRNRPCRERTSLPLVELIEVPARHAAIVVGVRRRKTRQEERSPLIERFLAVQTDVVVEYALDRGIGRRRLIGRDARTGGRGENPGRRIGAKEHVVTRTTGLTQ
jgi:hypothetical protein